MSNLQVEYFHAPDQLRRNAVPWNDLWQRSEVCTPTMRAEPLAIWMEHFTPTTGLCAVGVRSGERLLAVFPLAARRVTRGLEVTGLPCRWSVSQGDLLLDPECDQDAVLDLLITALGRLPRPLLWLDGVAADRPHWQAFLAAVNRQGWPVNFREQYRVAQVEIRSGWDAYFAARSAKHRGNRRNEARRLRRAGEVETHILSEIAQQDVQRLLAEGFEIEQRSWKSSAGTAVLQHAEMASYYLDLARELAAGGFLHLMFLKHQGTPIAFSFGWQAKGVSYGAKIGCDAAYRKYAPGHQLMMESLRRYHEADGPQRVDFVGPAADWHLSWATGTYPVGRLVVALPSRWSRAAFYLVTNWQPRMRRLASRVRGCVA